MDWFERQVAVSPSDLDLDRSTSGRFVDQEPSGPHRRAPVVGHARMRVHLLFQALYLNIRATIARMLRTGQQLPFTT